MYGQLFFDEQRGVLGVRMYFCTQIAPPILVGDQIASRKGRASAVLKDGCSDATKLNAIAMTMWNLAPLMDEADLDFGLYMALAHHTLPAETRAGREARIDQLIDAHLPDAKTLPPSLSPGVDLLRRTAITAPDPMMELLVRTQCGRLCAFYTTRQEAPMRYHVIGQAAGGLAQYLSFLGGPAVQFVTQCWTHRPVAEGDAFVDRISALLHGNRGSVLELTRTRCAERLAQSPPFASDALMDIMQEVNARPAMGPAATPEQMRDESLAVAEIVEAHVERMQRKDAILRDQVVRDSASAVRRKVPMGASVTANAQAALNRVDERTEQANLRITAARRTVCPPLSTVLPSPAANQEKADVDPVHAWSVDRLLRWIEGPLMRQPGEHRVDRKKVLEREHEASKRREQQPKPKGQPPRPAETPLTELEVNTIIMDGLATTAQFFLDDIHELVPLAEHLGAQQPLVAPCTQLIEPLKNLVLVPQKHDETEARTLLGSAEERITLLRMGVKAQQADAALQRRFTRQLAEALRSEPLARGKRHGGVIACPMRPADWPWVAAQFHNRWIVGANSLMVDGVPVALADNEALALYVTGSSQSRYAFDVSVHVWRRMPGSVSLPGLQDLAGEGFPPMNAAEWQDSYLTCAVLHVPPLT